MRLTMQTRDELHELKRVAMSHGWTHIATSVNEELQRRQFKDARNRGIL